MQVPGREAIRKKIAELSTAVAAEGGEAAAAALSEADLAEGGPLDSLLGAAAAAPSGGGGAATVSDADMAVLGKMLSWPAAQLFPALDIARLLVLERGAADRLAAAAGQLAAAGSGGTTGGLGAALAAATANPPVPAAQQTAARLACNCFVQPALLAWVQSAGSKLLEALDPAAASPNKNVRQGLATLLVNYSVMLAKLASSELEFKSRVSYRAAGRCWHGSCRCVLGSQRVSVISPRPAPLPLPSVPPRRPRPAPTCVLFPSPFHCACHFTVLGPLPPPASLCRCWCWL